MDLSYQCDTFAKRGYLVVATVLTLVLKRILSTDHLNFNARYYDALKLYAFSLDVPSFGFWIESWSAYQFGVLNFTYFMVSSVLY